MRPRKIVWSVPAGTSNGICQSQTPGAGGALTLNGSTVSSGIANLQNTMPNVSKYVDGQTSPAQRRVTIASTGNDSGRTFTITGYRAPLSSGDTTWNTAPYLISETIAGPNASSVTSVLDYAWVTGISVDAATAGAITVGTGATASTPWQIPELDLLDTAFDVSLGIGQVGTVTWGVEHQFDRVPPSKDFVVNPDVFPHSSIGPGQTAMHDGNYAFPVSGFRLTVTSGTGTLNFHWLQQGVVGGGSP